MTTSSISFFADESGAVTVDWVVLTAALVGLGLAVMSVVRGGVTDLTNNIGNVLCGIEIADNGDVDTGQGGSVNAAGTACE
ncbi:MAG: hypothetical protein AAF390_17575 [Pseudomonadota bacterium]